MMIDNKQNENITLFSCQIYAFHQPGACLTSDNKTISKECQS